MTGACMIGMNNDRAGSFLCSFQTFQTFNSVVRTGRLRACACTTRDTEHLPGGAAKSTSIQVQHSPVLVDIAEGMGHLFRALILILLRALTDARFFNTSVFFFFFSSSYRPRHSSTQAPKLARQFRRKPKLPL